MITEIPNFDDLLEYSCSTDDQQLQEIFMTFNSLSSISIKCLNELKSDDLQNDTGDIPNIKSYIFKIHLKSVRIFKSITLLIIYKQFNDAMILFRSLLENSLNLKILLKDKRGKMMRRIWLYNLINDEMELQKEEWEWYRQKSNEGYLLISKHEEASHYNTMAQINKGLSNYSKKEVEYMRELILKGKSWHGKNIGAALNKYIPTFSVLYKTLCAYSHCQETVSAESVSHAALEKSFYTLILFNYIEYIKDLTDISPNIFSSEYLKDELNNIRDNLFKKLCIDIGNELDPDFWNWQLTLRLDNPDCVNFFVKLAEESYSNLSENEAKSRSIYELAVESMKIFIDETDSNFPHFLKFLQDKCKEGEKP